MTHTMKAYWQDLEDVVDESDARPLTLGEALNHWADGRGVAGNYFGLIDEHDRAIQFYFFEGIPDEVEDAGSLRIVLADFPLPDQGGSLTAVLSIDETSVWIAKAFDVGANHECYQGLQFTAW